MRIILRHRLALLIILLHVVLGVLYSVAVPIWEAYDEWGHYPYVRYIATHGTLPSRDRPLVEYNDTVRPQPPLYYMLGAAATFWIDTSDWHAPVENRYSSLPTAMGGYNRALHGYDEDFPWKGWVLAVHVVRLVSVLLSTVTVWLTYLIGRILFPGRHEIALGAAAICAFWPQYLFIGSVINNDNMVATSGALVMLFMVRSVVGPPRWSDRVGLVLAQACAIASKIVGMAFLPVTLWGLFWSFRPFSDRNRKQRLVWFAGIVLAAGAVLFVLFQFAHPRYYVNFLRYAHPPTSLTDRGLAEWLNVARLMWGTLWASFGWQSVGIDRWVYDVIQPVWLIALCGLVAFFVRSREWAVKWALLGLLGAVAIVAAMTAYRGLFSAYYFTGRYLLSTIAAFSTLLAVGLDSVGPRRWSRVILGAVGVAMAAFAIYAPFAYIIPVYARPAKLAPEAVANLANPVHADFGHKIELVGYELDPVTFYPGETIHLSLYWQTLEEMDQNYTLAVKLIAPDDAEIASLNVHPGRGSYPTSMWRQGDIFKDTYWLPVAADAMPMSLARLKVAFFRDDTDLEHLPVYDDAGRFVDYAVFLGRFKVAPIAELTHNPQHPVKFDLGEAISLVGYDVSDAARAGQLLSLTFYWQARGTPEMPYTVFVHVVDEHGNLVAQTDGQPANGSYPTDLWEAGEVISDTHVVDLGVDLSKDRYQVWVGLYSVVTGQRLVVLDARGQPMIGDRIPLGSTYLESGRP